LELLLTAAVVAVLAVLQVAAAGPGAAKHATLACLANMRRLSLGWMLHANDHAGALALNYHGASAQSPPVGKPGWASGWLDWTTATDNTNVLKLTDPRYAALATYVDRQAEYFRCPTDTYLSSAQKARGWLARARSYSADILVGDGNALQGPVAPAFVQVKTLAAMIKPAPASTYVFLEEHPDSLNDPAFFAPYSTAWIDLPAAHHRGAATFTFGDGHAELRRWASPTTLMPVRVGPFTTPIVRPGDPDIAWLRARTPQR
jgi:prepilin-type processing-associated H-X9-DG protein